MRRTRALVVAIAALGALSCSTGAEQALLTQFFSASRLRDLTALQKIATVVFEPTRDGVVTSFDVTAVTKTAGSDEEDISFDAPVRLPDGRTAAKHFVVTVRGGLIRAISERPASPSVPPR